MRPSQVLPLLLAASSLLLVATPGLGLPRVANPLGPAAPVPPPTQDGRSDRDDADYSITFSCPSGLQDGSATAQTIRVGCPFRILDESDALGSPTLVVHHANPSEMAIASLHGGGEVEGPTPRSRDQGTSGAGLFTVFTSEDAGYNWMDQPSRSFYPPERQRSTFGEHMAIAMDAEGHLYGAGTFSTRGSASEPFGYRLVAWRWDTVDYAIRWASGFETFAPLAWPSVAEWVDLTYLPPADSPFFTDPPRETPNAGYRWANNTTTPDPPPSAAQRAPYEEAVVLTWLESAAGPNVTLEGKASRLRAAWTGANHVDQWAMLPANMSVGPCSSVSNGVAWDGAVYVACVVGDDAAYDHRRGVKTGDIDVWRIVPGDWRAELVSTTPVRGGNPRLAASTDGRFVVATVERTDAARVRFEAAFGWFADRWVPLPDFGFALQGQGSQILEARLQGLAFPRNSRMVHAVYQEVYPPVGFNLTDLRPPQLFQFSKRLVAFNQCQGPVLSTDLQVGLVHQYSPVTESGADFSLFNDLVDGFVLIPDAAGREREFLAYGDMGVVDFGEVVEVNPPVCPPEPAPALPEPPAAPLEALPVAQPALTPSQVAIGVAGGVLGLAALVRLIAVRRASSAEAPAGAGGRK